jgi:hypothetical protein
MDNLNEITINDKTIINISGIKEFHRLGIDFNEKQNGKNYIEILWEKINNYFYENNLPKDQQLNFLERCRFLDLLDYINEHNLCDYNLHTNNTKISTKKSDNICKKEGCNRKVYKNRLCSNHSYPCEKKGCNNRAVVNNLCGRHGPACEIKNCSNQRVNSLYCRKHSNIKCIIRKCTNDAVTIGRYCKDHSKKRNIQKQL